MIHAFATTLAVLIALYAVVISIIAAWMYQDHRAKKREAKRAVEEVIRMCREAAE